MILGKGKRIKSAYNCCNAVHMVDYSYTNKIKPICIETIGKNDSKYYNKSDATVAWEMLLKKGYKEI